MTSSAWLRRNWDRVVGWGLVALGAVSLVVGWFRLSNTPYPAEQMSFLASGGLIGAVLVVLGVGLLVSADLRDEWHALDRIEGLLRTQVEAAGHGTAVDPTDPAHTTPPSTGIAATSVDPPKAHPVEPAPVASVGVPTAAASPVAASNGATPGRPTGELAGTAGARSSRRRQAPLRPQSVVEA